MKNESSSDKPVHIELFTKRSHDDFFNADVVVNESGNVCIYLDEENFAVLTPKMAKRLSLKLGDASRSALAAHLSE